MANTPLKARTARTPLAADRQYVLIEGAPKHYVSGHGLVGPGEIVSLADGVVPGKYLVAVHPSDAAKAVESEEGAATLAAKAAEKASAAQEAADKTAKTAADKAAK